MTDNTQEPVIFTADERGEALLKKADDRFAQLRAEVDAAKATAQASTDTREPGGQSDGQTLVEAAEARLADVRASLTGGQQAARGVTFDDLNLRNNSDVQLSLARASLRAYHDREVAKVKDRLGQERVRDCVNMATQLLTHLCETNGWHEEDGPVAMDAVQKALSAFFARSLNEQWTIASKLRTYPAGNPMHQTVRILVLNVLTGREI